MSTKAIKNSIGIAGDNVVSGWGKHMVRAARAELVAIREVAKVITQWRNTEPGKMTPEFSERVEQALKVLESIAREAT